MGESKRGEVVSKQDEQFLAERNIQRFTRLLETENDPDKRAVLNTLLREQREKLAN